MTHICVIKLTIIVPDNGLSPDRRQAIIWINAGIMLIRTPGTNFSEIVSKIHIFSFEKMHLKISSAKLRPFCLGLNVLKRSPVYNIKTSVPCIRLPIITKIRLHNKNAIYWTEGFYIDMVTSKLLVTILSFLLEDDVPHSITNRWRDHSSALLSSLGCHYFCHWSIRTSVLNGIEFTMWLALRVQISYNNASRTY